MKHFFESLKREVDFQKEYEKLEEMVLLEKHLTSDGYNSINHWIENNFRKWSNRSNYTSFYEVREQMGFPFKNEISSFALRNDIGRDDYFSYCEMIVNIIEALKRYLTPQMLSATNDLRNTMKATIEEVGFEINRTNDEYIVIEKNSLTSIATKKVPYLSDCLVGYNRYSLKGNLEGKRAILRDIANAIEPKRRALEGLNKRITDDFFFMVNNMNIRHNNCDPTDDKHYKPQFDKLTKKEKEEWYDEIYEQSLMVLTLEAQDKRNKAIVRFKASNVEG